RAAAGRRGAIVEAVALVPLAARAVVLRPRHDQLQVGLRADRAGQRRIEARPAGAAFELGVGREQRQVAAGAVEKALPLPVVERARAGTLGAFLAEHRVLIGREALLPLGVVQAQGLHLG